MSQTRIRLRWPRLVPVLAVVFATAGTGCVRTTYNRLPEPGPDTSEARQAESRRDLGMDHLSKGRTALAIRELLTAANLVEDDHETQLWLGEAYRRKAMLDKAAAHLERSVELKPDFHASRLNLSGLYIQMERFEDAQREAEILIEDPTFPTPWRALTNKGWAQFNLGHPKEARATMREALDFHPTYWPALLNLAIIEAAEGNRLEAIERFGQVLEQEPGRNAQAETHFRLAEVYVALGHRERAIRHFSDAIDGSPYGIWGEQSKRYLRLLR